MKDIIILLVGESGSGKTTVANLLEEKYGLKSLSSYTTRPKRTPNETGHIFVTDEEFDQLKDICAYTEFNGYRYCATSEQVDNSDVYVIDVAGIDYFKEHYKGGKVPLVVYITVDTEVRRDRMLYRGDPPERAEERIQNDLKEFFNVLSRANIMIRNISIRQTVEEIMNEYSIMKYEVNHNTDANS